MHRPSALRTIRVGNITQLRTVFQIRHDVYVEELGYLDFEDYDEPLEVDEYDDYANHFLLYKDRTPIGTVRIIENCPHNKLGLPVQKAPNVKRFLPYGKMGEVSRLVLVREARGKGYLIPLLREIFRYAKSQKLDYLCLDAFSRIGNNRCLKMYKKLLFRPFVEYWDPVFRRTSIVMVLDLNKVQCLANQVESRVLWLLINGSNSGDRLSSWSKKR